MRLLPAAIAVIVGVPAAYVFFLLGGINALRPPVRYGLDITLDVVVNGTVRTMRQGVLCTVRDQRGSIAARDFSIKSEGDPLYMSLDGAKALILSDFRPCRWTERPPAAGTVYRMVSTATQEQWVTAARSTGREGSDEVGFMGRLSLIDNVGAPRVVRSATLNDAISVLGVSIRGGTFTRNDQPERHPVPALFITEDGNGNQTPKRTHEFSAELKGLTHECKDRLPSGEKWYELSKGPCLGRSDAHATVYSGDDITRIDIVPDAEGTPEWVTLLESALPNSEPGEMGTEGSEWTETICVDGSCFEMKISRYGEQRLRLYHGTRKVYLEVVHRSSSASERLTAIAY